jgi:hypothetical protein
MTINVATPVGLTGHNRGVGLLVRPEVQSNKSQCILVGLAHFIFTLHPIHLFELPLMSSQLCMFVGVGIL